MSVSQWVLELGSLVPGKFLVCNFQLTLNGYFFKRLLVYQCFFPFRFNLGVLYLTLAGYSTAPSVPIMLKTVLAIVKFGAVE